MPSSNELHVIFGTGPLGKATMRELVKNGKPIRMVNRSGKADVPAGVEVVAGNAYDATSAAQVAQGASVVYQCAQPAYHEWPEKFPPLQAAILEGAAAANAKFIVAENLYMYGEVKGLIREDAPYAATTRKGRTRAQMSETLFAAHKSGKVRAASARGSDFFGPEVRESLIAARAIYPALAGKSASLMGNLDLLHTMTYIDDFGKAMAILGERDEALGQAWHVPNAETLTQRQFMTILFAEIGKPPKMSSIPKLMLVVAGIFMPGAREIIEMSYLEAKPFVVDSSKFVRAFGNIATPNKDAIQQTVNWYKQHPAQK